MFDDRALQAGLRSVRPGVRRRAAAALTGRDDAMALELLTTTVLAPPDIDVFNTPLRWLARFALPPARGKEARVALLQGGDAALAALCDLYRQHSTQAPFIRGDRLEALATLVSALSARGAGNAVLSKAPGQLDERRAASQTLLALLRNESDYEIRAAAIDGLLEQHPRSPRLFSALMRVLDNPNEANNIRLYAAQNLAQMATKQDVAAIGALLKTARSYPAHNIEFSSLADYKAWNEVQMQIVETLAQIGGLTAIPSFFEILDEGKRDEIVLRHTAHVLTRPLPFSRSLLGRCLQSMTYGANGRDVDAIRDIRRRRAPLLQLFKVLDGVETQRMQLVDARTLLSNGELEASLAETRRLLTLELANVFVQQRGHKIHRLPVLQAAAA